MVRFNEGDGPDDALLAYDSKEGAKNSGARQPAGLRLGFVLGATVPIGTGGSRAADPLTWAANGTGAHARSTLDNAMFAVNDFTLSPSIDFAYVGHRWTVQAEATLLQLMRVKNEAVQSDAFHTNFTTGLHVGFFAAKGMSIATELRYQRWLTTPDAVAADEGLRENLSLSMGPRFHIKAERGWLRPSVAYNGGLTGCLASNSYHMVLVDIPYVFIAARFAAAAYAVGLLVRMPRRWAKRCRLPRSMPSRRAASAQLPWLRRTASWISCLR